MAGKRPRVNLRMLPSRRRRFDPIMTQANRGTPFPTFMQQPATKRKPRVIRRNRIPRWFPTPPQGNRGQAFASFIRLKGPRVKVLARLLPSRRRRWIATYKHVTNTIPIKWNTEFRLTSSIPIEWAVLNHVVSSIAIEWNVGTTVQSRPHLMTSQGWEQGTNAARLMTSPGWEQGNNASRLMTEEGKGYMGGE
jgi:hypothetical protein